MKKLDPITLAKIGGFILTVGGSLLTGWSTKKSQDKLILENLEKLANK